MTEPTQPAEPASDQLGPLQERVLAALRSVQIEPRLDPDGDIEVRVADQVLFVQCVPSQPELLRVFGSWQLGPDSDELTRLRAANAVTGAVNLVKATVEDDRLAIAIDLLVGPQLELRSLLPSALDAVLGSARTWHETVTQLLLRDHAR